LLTKQKNDLSNNCILILFCKTSGTLWIGECRRRSPIEQKRFDSQWPNTLENDWCGDELDSLDEVMPESMGGKMKEKM